VDQYTYVQTARNRKGVKLAQARLDRYLVPALGWKLLGKVTADDLRSYRLWLEQQGISRQTVAHVLSDARCFFGWCEDSGLIVKSPVPRKLLPRIPERPPDRLTDAEVDALVRVADPYGFVVRFALATGLRWGELCRAQAADIENGMLVVSGTKSGRIRRVPLRRTLQKELWGRVGKLVPFSSGSCGSFALIVRRESRVARFRPHMCRHTFACRWLEEGGSLAALQEILGHSTVLVTQRYARLTDEIVRKESERLEGYLEKR
jgi:integrase